MGNLLDLLKYCRKKKKKHRQEKKGSVLPHENKSRTVLSQLLKKSLTLKVPAAYWIAIIGG